MHIRIENSYSEITSMEPEEQRHWPELYKMFTFEVPGAERTYPVQLKQLCIKLIGTDIVSLDHLESETRKLTARHRWQDKLWEWYVEKAVKSVPIPATSVEIRNRLSSLMKLRGKDSTHSLISSYMFPTGLMPVLVEFAMKHKMPITTLDLRGVTKPNFNYTVMKPGTTLPLRPYQWAAASCGINNKVMGMDWPRGIFQIPTGGGKTEIAIALSEMHVAGTLFLVNRKELLNQTFERFQKAMPTRTIGCIGDGIYIHDKSKIIIASVQTLWSLLKKQDPRLTWLRDNTSQLIIDEAHGIAAGEDVTNSLVKVCDYFVNTPVRWGLTATPMMRDNLSNALLQGVTGDVIFKMTNTELIKLGYITRPKIVLTTVDHKNSYEDPITKQELRRPPGSQWKELYDFTIVKNPFRNKAIGDIIRIAPSPCILLVQRLDHIHYIDLYSPSRIQFLRGTSTRDERELAKQRLRSGEIKILGATTIFDEGVDIPELKSIILAGGGKSNIKTLQRIGRGMRLATGKTEVIIYDFIDMNMQSPGWIPMKHSKERLAVYKKEGFEIDTR